MRQIRVISPPAVAEALVARLRDDARVADIALFRGAGVRPSGDVIAVDVPDEAVSAIISQISELIPANLAPSDHAIRISPIEVSLSSLAAPAEQAAVGVAHDAVVWETLEASVAATSELSLSFLALMAIALFLAAIALLSDSVVLLIGAMVVAPEYGPLAAIAVAISHRSKLLGRRIIWRSALALTLGFLGPMVVCYLLMLGLIAADAAPAYGAHPFTDFVSSPDAYSLVVAFLAGVAGMISLVTSKSGALVGVFISATTMPAAANIAIAAAYDRPHEVWGSVAQLGINMVLISLAGAATVTLLRSRRVRAAEQRLRSMSGNRN